MEIKEQLDSNIPESAVTTREAWRGGPTLSYLTGAYVIDRMNKVVGQGNWGYEIRNLTRVFEGGIEQSSGKVFTTSYLATIHVWALIGDKQTGFTEVGYGDGTDKKSQGKAHELATKEAVTDGMKRAVKNFGISMGLGLYFKGEEYVDEAPATKPAEREASKVASPKAQQPPAPAAPKSTPVLASERKANENGHVSILRKQIKESFGVLTSLKKITKDEFVSKYLKGAKADSLDEPSAIVVISSMKQDFPDVAL